MNNIALIYMGGTFGCIGEPLQPMPASDFIPQLKKILSQYDAIDYFVAPVIKDSSACSATDWLQLIQLIQKLHTQHYQYFVVIHGTDTLSYASAVLAQCLAHSAHVILTGSQYPLLSIDGLQPREKSDALDNLNFALQQVRQVQAGVYLAFHQRLLHGASTFKQHTTELDAFYGISAKQHLPSQMQPLSIHAAHLQQAEQFNCLSLMLQPIDIAQQIQNLSCLIAHPPTALILQGFGTGNIAINNTFLATLNQIQAHNCAVIISSQVPFGPLDQRYAVSEWIQQAHFLVSHCYSHADLYAKTLKMHLKYPNIDQWYLHWQDEI